MINSKFQENALSLLHKTAEALKSVQKEPSERTGFVGSSSGEATRNLKAISRIITGLPTQNLKELFDKVIADNSADGVLMR